MAGPVPRAFTDTTAPKIRTPMLITAGQQARSILPFDPSAQDVPQASARADSIAMTPPRGPVLVSVPVDDWDQPAEYVQASIVITELRPQPAAVAG